MQQKHIKDTDDMLSLQSCWCPPLDDEFKHWGYVAVGCFVVTAILFICFFTFWDIYD